MPANVELRIASRLLPTLIAQSDTRDVNAREIDVQHAIDVAALLMRRFAGSPHGQAHQTYIPSPASRPSPRASTVDRAQLPPTFPSQEDWRKARGLQPVKAQQQSPKRESGPSLP